MNYEGLIDAEAASRLLGIHPKTVKRLAAAGVIPAMRIGRLWKFRASALDDWMAAQLKSSGHPCPEKGEQ
jgi:excisionase family DNA binding protein